MIRRGIGVQSYVSAGGGTDADAQAFITAAGITDVTQQSAINTLVTDLKGYGIWSKMKAIWPFVGGTSSSHKWNLKDPRDLDAAFRLVFNGGATHSSTGYLPNGTNGYADTFLTPSTNLTNNNYSLSYYSRTQATNLDAVDLGCTINTNGTPNTGITLYFNSVSYKAFNAGSYPNDAVLFNNNDTQGLLIGSRTANNSAKMFMDGVQIGSTLTTTYSGTLPTTSLFLGSNKYMGNAVEFTNRQCAFASIGDGLTDTEAANLYTAVQAYQTTLSRNV